MNRIHSTAIINKQAELHEARVDAFVTIGGDVCIGPGTVIGANSHIKAGSRIGSHNVIGENCVIGGDPQDLKFDTHIRTGVSIGDRNTIREMTTIHRATLEGTSTTVGNECYLMALSHLGHDVRLGNRIIVSNNSLLAGFVQVGDDVMISGSCTIHQFVRIGRNALVAALSKVGKDIPPFCIAEGYPVSYRGVNVIGLRRCGFSSEERTAIKQIYKKLYQKTGIPIPIPDALNKEREQMIPLQLEVLDFIEGNSERGLLAFKDKIGRYRD